MINLRRISQLVFLALFIYLLLMTVEPLRGLIPQNLFFIADPLVAIATILASRTFLMAFIASGVVIISAVLLGRVFCAWACPLGTSIDIFNRLKRNKPFGPSYHKPKYLILLLIIVIAILGVNIVGWFDPITIVFKSFGLVLYPVGDFLIKGAIDGVGLKDLSKPLGSINLLDRNPVLYHGSVIFFLLFAAILIATLYQTRFWCRTICPLGGLLGLLGKWRLLRVDINSKCTDCGKCAIVCKTGAISKELKLYDEECINCYSCVAGCPADAMTLNFRKPKMEKLPVLPERRGLLITAGLGVLSVPLLKRSFGLKRGYTLPRLRPPGALAKQDAASELVFQSKCIRCGECMKVCPTNGLQPLMFESGLSAMWSPVLVPRVGNCRHYCNACGQVCPTGAIAPLPLEEKQEYKIGLAYFDITRCIPYVHKQKCLTCEEFCPVPEKAIEHYEKDGIPYPYMVKERCIGCGLCEKVCPVPGLAAIRVSPLNEIVY